MKNEEIRIKIAQAKGIEVAYPFDGKFGPYYQTGLTADKKPYLSKLPNWPVNIADAWELVEEAQAEPHEQTFEIVHTPAISDKWKVTIGTAFSAAATAPLAICAAWLAWDAARKAEKLC